jgi:hypothetical protein
LANHIPEDALAAIEDVVRRRPGRVSALEILLDLQSPIAPRTLQYRLRYLVARNRLVMDGKGRWAKYRIVDAAVHGALPADAYEAVIPLSTAGTSIRDYVRQAPEARKPVGYDRGFLRPPTWKPPRCRRLASATERRRRS